MCNILFLYWFTYNAFAFCYRFCFNLFCLLCMLLHLLRAGWGAQQGARGRPLPILPGGQPAPVHSSVVSGLLQPFNLCQRFSNQARAFVSPHRTPGQGCSVWALTCSLPGAASARPIPFFLLAPFKGHRSWPNVCLPVLPKYLCIFLTALIVTGVLLLFSS